MATTNTPERLASQTSCIHVMPLGSTMQDFYRSNDVVPVATYYTSPWRVGGIAPHPDCVREVMRLHPGHELSYLSSNLEDDGD